MISQVVDLITNHCDLNLTNLLKKILASLAGPVLAGCKRQTENLENTAKPKCFSALG